MVLYGTFETRGKNWFDPAVTQPSTRVLDQTQTWWNRGHLYFKELFEPVKHTVTTGVLEWDSGSKLSTVLHPPTVEPLTTRKLITMDPSNARVEVKQVLTATSGGEAFNTSAGGNCAGLNGGHYDCDLNNSGGPPDADDRTLMLNWLYGWESGTGTAGIKRTWPMGGVQLSTPRHHRHGLGTVLADQAQHRGAGQLQAELPERLAPGQPHHGGLRGHHPGLPARVEAGVLKTGDDPCTNDVYEARGYFAMSTPCSTSSASTARPPSASPTCRASCCPTT